MCEGSVVVMDGECNGDGTTRRRADSASSVEEGDTEVQVHVCRAR